MRTRSGRSPSSVPASRRRWTSLHRRRVTDGDDESMLSSAGERRRATVVVSRWSRITRRSWSGSHRPRSTPRSRRIRAAAVDTMRRHGGVVNQSIGEEIVSLFGIPAAHEDDDLRAVRAAFELHARTREISSSIGDRPVPPSPAIGSARRVGGRPTASRGASALCGHRSARSDCRAARGGRGTRRDPGEPGLPPRSSRRSCGPSRVRRVVVRADAPPVTPHCVLGESGLESRLEAPDRGGLTPYTGRTRS